MNVIIPRSLGSNLRKLKTDAALSWNLVARNSPVIMPSNENTLLSKPFFNPRKAGIKIKTKIIISRVFKILF